MFIWGTLNHKLNSIKKVRQLKDTLVDVMKRIFERKGYKHISKGKYEN